ncbi:helix-turn-helix domain-containing protein [Orientia tsutsugamushi]|uniref:helix-turn-helix domain-containing protein n=1 Tax=Orientia tsutsugamushi TaxID=784 RepID=UPI003528943D
MNKPLLIKIIFIVIDFWEKVIKCVNQGKSCNATSVKFDIAANTVRNWYKRYKSEGHYKERDRLGKIR